MPIKPTTRSPENPFTKRREPLQFMLWLGIGGSVLIFTTLLAIYIIRKVGPDWQQVSLPGIFWISTFVILLSSVTMHEAHRAFLRERFPIYRSCLGATLTLGVMFVFMQLWGWIQMLDQGIGMQDSAPGAFVYLLSGLHIAHIIGGLAFLGFAFWDSLKNMTYIDAFVYSVNPPNRLKMKLITTYWHFVDVLWIYLFLFLLFHHSA
ncbi:cytochrome c oxidase subunit 3 [Telluribacter sp.]|jgi:cytochrome c oxidase subunit 3|uniref:cytochrome c oxidase subunit 3 n=1 Tax=Telluribacter sp. TaxID=1978767 RepID=UPI002E1178FD|nr:cytochrome c oxidase subunit 3 [Telluribacter sp.]